MNNSNFERITNSYKELFTSLSSSKSGSLSSKFYDLPKLTEDANKSSARLSSLSKSSSLNFDSDTKRKIEIKRNAENIKDTVLKDDFYPGETSKTELLMIAMHSKDELLFRESFQKAWLELYSLKDEDIAKFISIASSLEYDMLDDKADALVIAGYAHINPIVNESVIRAVEMWGEKRHIEFLNKMRPTNIAWLDKYKDDVIQDLEL